MTGIEDNEKLAKNVRELRARLIKKSLASSASTLSKESLFALDKDTLENIINTDSQNQELWHSLGSLNQEKNRTFDSLDDKKNLNRLIGTLKTIEKGQDVSTAETQEIFSRFDPHKKALSPLAIIEDDAQHLATESIGETAKDPSIFDWSNVPSVDNAQKVLFEINSNDKIPDDVQALTAGYLDYLKNNQAIDYYDYFNKNLNDPSVTKINERAQFFVELNDLFTFLNKKIIPDFAIPLANELPRLFIAEAKNKLIGHIHELIQSGVGKANKKIQKSIQEVVNVLTTGFVIPTTPELKGIIDKIDTSHFGNTISAFKKIIDIIQPITEQPIFDDSAFAAVIEKPIAAPVIHDASLPHPYYLEGFINVPLRDVPVYDDELTAELKTSYIEEATDEIFPLIDASSENLQYEPYKEESILDLRRAFHTLKGSGFMASFVEAGEIAWQIERVINEVRDNHFPFSEAIFHHAQDGYKAIKSLINNEAIPENTLGRIAYQADYLIKNKGIITPQAPKAIVEVPSVEVPHVSELHSYIPGSVNDALIPDPIAHDFKDAFEDEALIDDFKKEFLQEGVYSETSKFYSDFLADEALDNHELVTDGNEVIGVLTDAFALCQNTTHTALKKYARTVNTCYNLPVFSMKNSFNHLFLAAYHKHLLLYRAHGLTPRAETLELWGNVLNLIIDIINGKDVDQSIAQSYISELSRPIIALSTQGQASQKIEAEEPEVDEELYAAFLEESHEILERANELIQEWRLTNYDPQSELVAELRRQMHTIKGSARMVGKVGIGQLSHAIESLLEPIHIKLFNSDPRRFDLLQRALDHIPIMLEYKSSAIDAEGYNFLSALHVLLGNETPPEMDKQGNIEGRDTVTKVTDETSTAAQTELSSLRIAPYQLTQISESIAENMVLTNQQRRNISQIINALHEVERTIVRVNAQARQIEIETEAQIISRHARAAESGDFDPLELDQFSELQHLSRSIMESVEDFSSLHKNIAEVIDQITTNTDKQASTLASVSKTLTDIGTVSFMSIMPRLRRIVRQVSKDHDKKVELIAIGTDIQVERVLLEQMVAPFEHMIRNSIIHGIEHSPERLKAGKPEIGKITLKVIKQGAELTVQLIDDGRGFDTNKIRAKAIGMGLINKNEMIDDDELVSMTMLPGFTTAEDLSQDAGRGVGLDILAKAMIILKAQSSLINTPQKGVTFEIRIPFTLTVINTLIINAGSRIFSIPLSNIIGVVQNKGNSLNIDESKQSFVFRQERYKIYDLNKIYGDLSIYSKNKKEQTYLLYHSEEHKIAIGINKIIAQQEVIMKPLNPQISSVPGIVGSALMPNGDIIYILDIPRLSANKMIQSSIEEPQRQALDSSMIFDTLSDEIVDVITPTIMVVDDSITMRKVSSRMLQRVGLRVTTAKDGLDAVEKLETEHPDLILLDIEMPRMDGFEVLTHLKSLESLSKIPVIMVTSRTGEKHKQRAFDLGANEYCGKPYQEEDLLNMVKNLLGDKWEND